MTYRPEIDVLRALAVLPVIFFHAGIDGFDGGFVGVDIFFVISGYLITSIIINEVSTNSFSLINFYERRARRILPALFFIMAVSIPFAWLLLMPYELRDFGESLVAVSTFSSNILFWIERGYFEPAAELKPLLHTWSLAVEEQFYILFPVFLILILKNGIKVTMQILILLFFISIILAHWATAVQSHPKIISGAFFLLPARGWELLIGVFIAFYVKHYGYTTSEFRNNIFITIGLAMIAYSIIFFNKNTPFPSLYTLVPTIGTALIIISNVPKTYFKKFFINKLFVLIGLISYSAYLWHQPIIAFTRYYFGNLSDLTLIGLCIFSLLPAWLSWKYIELPFRDNKKVTRKTIFLSSFLAALVISSIGIWLSKNDGFTSRLNPFDANIIAYERFDRSVPYRENICFTTDIKIGNYFSSECYQGKSLIWGDSQAAALSYGLRHYDEFAQLTASSCPPVVIPDESLNSSCIDINKHIIDNILAGSFKHIYLHGNWSSYNKNVLNAVHETVTSLLQNNNEIKITFIGDVPEWHPNLPTIIARTLDKYPDKNEVPFYIKNLDQDLLDKSNKALMSLFSDHLSNKNFNLIFPSDLLCLKDNCIAIIDNNNPAPIAWDYGHLTDVGSLFLASKILQ